MHEPGWHQQFLVTYMIINRQVWDGLSGAQQTLIQSVGRDHILASYAESMRQQGNALKSILTANGGDGDGHNDIVLVRWPEPALERLRNATIKYLNARTSDTSFSAADRQDYSDVLEALRRYVRSNRLYWREREAAPWMRFERWTNGAGEAW
jgi:TRAP-type mannitol/chloroaromatic compound transport system substrate-binding protein